MHECVQGGARREYAQHAAGERKQQSLDQSRDEQAAARCAKRDVQRKLVRSRAATRQQKAREIHTNQENEHQHRRQQDHEAGPDGRADDLLQGTRLHVQAFIKPMRFGNSLLEQVQLGHALSER